MYNFSVIIPVHLAVTTEQFSLCLESIYSQTLPPSEIVIVKDGAISDQLSLLINNYLENTKINLRVFSNLTSQGPGLSRNKGVENATFPIVAFMDADDVSCLDRFAKQIPIIVNERIDLVGGQIQELDEKLECSISFRTVPLTKRDIKKNFKFRNSINNVTVAIKRDTFLAVGGYPDLYFGEDYVLWLKLSEAGYDFKNVDSVLVKVRTGNDFLNRRFGKDYVKKNFLLFKHLIKYKEVGLFYGFLRLFYFTIVFFLSKRTQYFLVKRFTRNLHRYG